VAVSRLWVVVTRLRVSITRSQVVFPPDRGNLARLLTAAVTAATTFLLG
jgi:hypothetical protein